MGTKIIEQGSTAGGIAKVQYLDESGNVLYEVNDSDKIFKMVNGKISGLAGTGSRMVVADSSGNLSASGDKIFSGSKSMGSSVSDWTDLTSGALPDGIYEFYVNFWYIGTFHFMDSFKVCITKDPTEVFSYSISSNGKIASISTGTGSDFGKINLSLSTLAGSASFTYKKLL